MFKNYVFDLYGTLIDIYTKEDSSELWQKMALLFGYSSALYTPEELMLKYHELTDAEFRRIRQLYPQYSRVDIDLSRVFRALYEHKGFTPSDEQVRMTAGVFRCISTKHIRLYDGVIDLLDTLRQKKKNIYLLSNAQRDFTVPEMDMLGLTGYFNDILISSDVYCAKPDTAVYDILFSRNRLKKDESVMIGNDCISDISSATAFGIKSLYIHQSISSPITVRLTSNWRIMNGDVKRIKKLIVI